MSQWPGQPVSADAWPGQPAPQEGVDFSFKEMLSNIPESAVNYGKDMVGAVTNPKQTLMGVAGLAHEVMSGKTAQSIAANITGEEMQGAPYSQAVQQGIDDRYGSADKAKQTLMNDPVGAFADVAGMGVAGRVPGVSKVAAAAEPVNLAGKAARTATKAVIPESAANKLYQSAAKFSTTLSPEKRAKIVQTALDNGIMPTRRGVVKVDNRVDVLNASLDDLIDAATESGKDIPVNAVFQHFGELRKTKGGVKAEGAADLRAIDRFAKEFHQHMKGRTHITPKEMQQFKVDAYQKINWDAKRMTGSPIKEDTFKTMARGAKDSIEKAVPEAHDINKALGELYELQPHLVRAANRIENRNLLSINAPMNIGAGGVLGSAADATGLGATIGMFGAALGNPKIKAGVAIALNKLKQGDIGWLEANLGSAEVRIALAMAGRLNDETNTSQESSQ